MNGSEEIDLGFSLAGRLRNVSLPPSQSNSLVPLFESISNAIHAIEERFCDDAAKMGKISIKTKRGKIEGSTQVSGFVVTDNGSGLNESNWTSFRTSDSPHKFQKGPKGVGRLGLLKAFEAV